MPAVPDTQGRALPDPFRGLLAAAAAAVCAALLYLPAIGYGFVFDDLSLLTAAGEPVALGGALPYRPLRYASYLVDWVLGGSATVFHLHNVLLHAVVAALTALVARRLGALPVAAFAGALVVALHPLAVEAAAYVAGRRDLLCVALGLACVLAQLGGRTRAALAFFVLSVASKESGLVFAAPLAAAMLLFSGPYGRERRLAGMAVAVSGAAALSLFYGAVGPWLPGAGAQDIAGAGRVLLHYATGLAGLRVLAPEYPALIPAAAAHDAASLAAAALALLTLAAAVVATIRANGGAGSRAHAFVLLWTAATVAALAVWAGIHEPGADRHAYLLLPPIGVGASLMLSAVLRAPASSAARLALAAGGAVLAVLAAATSREQMQVWSSERALWSRAVAQPAASARAHANMARVDAADGDYVRARRHLAAALAAGDDDGFVYGSRAAVRCAEGRPALAQRDVRRAYRSGAGALAHGIARDCGLSLRARMRLPRRHARPLEVSGK